MYEHRKFRSSDSAIYDANSDYDAFIYIIANAYAREDDDTLTEEDKDLLALRTEHTDRKTNGSAEFFFTDLRIGSPFYTRFHG